MRIAHVVTLISPDGAYGGPTRVATNLARAMQDAGHKVTILGAFRGYDAPPAEIGGVPARLFPVRRILPGLGFAGLSAPGLHAYLYRHISTFDVVHIHLARDLVTLPAAVIARRRGARYVVQTHGMVDPSRRRLAKALDALATRAVLRDAGTAFYLTEQERRDVEQVARTPGLAMSFLPNGVPQSDLHADVGSGREVLFLARLAPRKRPLAFVEAAIALRGEFPATRFTLVGPDEGEASAVVARIDAAGARGAIVWEGPLEPSRTLERMSRASIYVLPALNEPFGMTVVEAMSVGLPSIVTDTCELVPLLHDREAVRVVDESVAALVAELTRLLRDRDERVALGARGRAEVESNFSIDSAATLALHAYPARAPQATR